MPYPPVPPAPTPQPLVLVPASSAFEPVAEFLAALGAIAGITKVCTICGAWG